MLTRAVLLPSLFRQAVPREELFLISKVWNDKIYEGPAAVRAQVETTLADLGVEYLDLYLIHWSVYTNTNTVHYYYCKH